ncbi:hypothetical protein R3P38DRAFT_3277540 [Favolaschia claudopus]|uniref:DUF6535 domain-containing protein n=1 Tax=Favolaschia claudopus TaxID=2862362 RepID=A0AAW0AKR8_9AGAR
MSSNDSGSSEAGYSHDTAGTKLWSVYVSEAEKYDKALVDSWKSNMEGLLIFAGLFSAILTAFLIESYKTLTPDSGDDMKALLTQISTQLSGIANGSSVSDLPAPGSFVPPTSSVVCNLLWFISLGLSLSCALIATLVEQWARDFKYKTEMRSTPVIRARIFSYLYYGLKRFNMHAIVEVIPFLLHTSLILFFTGLVAFLTPVNKAVMITVIILLSIVVIAYTILTIFPLFSSQSPYQTPISTGLWRAIQLTRSIWSSTSDRKMQPVSMVDAMNKAALEDSDQRAHRDYRALSWTLKSLSDDVELEPFLEGIVDALATTEDNWITSGNLGHHGRSPYDEPIRRLLQSREARLLERVDQFLRRCESTIILSDTQAQAQARRQLIALKSVWAMATIPAKRSTNDGNLLHLEPIHFYFPPRSPLAVNEHKLSVNAVLRLNMFLNAMHTVNTTIHFLNNQQPTPEDMSFLLVPNLVDIVGQYFKHRRQTFDSRWSLDRHSLDNLTRAIRHLPRDFGGRFRLFAASEPFAGCQATLNSLHQSLIYKGHEDFLDFMIHASRLEKPPYQFRRTEKLLLAWFDLGRVSESPDIVTIYSDAFNKVIDHQSHDDASYKPHVDNILAALLDLLVHFQEASPDSTVSLPSNLRLSLYFMKPYFDPSKLHVFRDCNKWWLCSCLTMELTTVPPHLHSESSTEQILRAMWEVAADKGTRFRGSSSPHTPIHPSQSMLEALHEITEYPESISIIPLIQTAILNDTSLRFNCEQFLFGTAIRAPANSTPRLAKEDSLRTIETAPRLSVLDMCVGVVAEFIRQASTLHSPPYKVNETMSIITRFVPHPPGVSSSQQLNFATSWKTALGHDSPEGFPATLMEIISTCPLLQMYWDGNTTQFRWLDDCEAATLFIEGIDIAEGWEEISPISRTRLAAIRESLMTIVDGHEGGIGESTISTIDLEALNISW